MPGRAFHTGSVSRRDVVKGAAALAAGAAFGSHLAPGRALAQAPKRGGVVTVRAWDPPHFDPHLTISYKTHIAYSFTHSRLLKYKAGPSVAPGVFPIEGDIAESWTQPNETTYVFKLRPGVRWHAKPPVNGRELTADDVVYSVERFRTIKGNANAYMLSSLDKVEALDKYTVRFTLKEPFVWFLDMIANPHAVAIIAPRVRGQVRRPEEARGDGRHRPLDARQLPAERRHDHGPASRLLHGRPALHRPRGARGRRGQCLAHGRLPLGQVRPRLGVHGHHQPGGLGEHQGLAQAEAAAAADASTSRRRS